MEASENTAGEMWTIEITVIHGNKMVNSCKVIKATTLNINLEIV